MKKIITTIAFAALLATDLSFGIAYADTINLSSSPTGTVTGAVGVNSLNILNDTLATDNNSFAIGLSVGHTFGGPTVNGGREGFQSYTAITAPTSPANGNRNYVGMQGIAAAQSGDNGTDLGANARGALFGMGAWADAQNGATNLLDVTGFEINTSVRTGASARYKSIGAFVGHALDAIGGSSMDAMIVLSNQAATRKWDHGILFSNYAGFYPLGSSSTLIGSTSGSIAHGVDLSSLAISGTAFKSPGFSVGGTGGYITLNGGNAGMEIGASASNTPYFDFHSSATPNDYDFRLIASGGGSATGQGSLSMSGNTLNLAVSSLQMNGIVGVTCVGPPTALFAVTKGIVTHC
jgi:hypothetical protein